jgi:hypothetical protein
MRQNATTPIAKHQNKQDGTELMDGYYVVGITPMQYPWFGVIINIIYKEDNTYHITIGSIPRCTCPYFTKMLSGALGQKKEIDVLQTSIICVQISLQSGF